MIDVKEPIVFEWDKGNELKNWIKHKVSKAEVEAVFTDTRKIVFSDIEHSQGEDRYIAIAKTKQGRLLFTVFTIRGEEVRIRIISSRDADRKEVAIYEEKAHIARF